MYAILIPLTAATGMPAWQPTAARISLVQDKAFYTVHEAGDQRRRKKSEFHVLTFEDEQKRNSYLTQLEVGCGIEAAKRLEVEASTSRDHADRMVQNLVDDTEESWERINA